MNDLLLTNQISSRKLTKRDGLIALALIVVSALIRVIYALHIHWVSLIGDMVHYDHAAQMIVNRHTLSFWSYQPDAFVTPGYPIFLAICYRIALVLSHSHQAGMKFAILVQALLSSATAGFLYFIARRALKSKLSILVSLLWIVYPPAINSVAYLLTETLYVFFLLLFIWWFLIAMERQQLRWWLLSGIALGLTGLVRPTVYPLAIAALIYLLYLWKSRGMAIRSAILQYVAYVVGFVLPLLPWWIRNYVDFHQLILSDTEVGNPLLFGSDPFFQSGPLLGHGLSQVQQKALAMHRIVTGFEHQPLLYLQWYTVSKLNILFGKPWYPPTTHMHPFIVTWVHFHLVWVILGTIGILVGLANRQMRFVSLIALFLILVQLPFIPVNRYGFPVLPLMFVGVGVVIQAVLERFFGTRKGRGYA